MPKGRMGISGSGPFSRISLPDPGQPAAGPEQQKLLDLDTIRAELIHELKARRPTVLSQEEADGAWHEIIEVVGIYLGQSKRGRPPTAAQRDKSLERIKRAASKLEAEIDKAHVNVTDLLHKALRRRGGDLRELHKQLAAFTDPGPITEEVRQAKGRPDPYLENLIRQLVRVWTRVVGKSPGKTGEDHYQGGRTSPFYRWSNRIAEVGIGKNLPRDLIDTIIELKRPDG